MQHSPDTAKTAAEASEIPASSTTTLFPIVGIGASAGGLNALEQFLRPIPPDCGLAFVVVQHLDPTAAGALPALLQRVTALKVVPITDRLTVQPQHVYVIPPNRDLSLSHGLLHLSEPTAPRGLRLPIDFLFRSLAEEQREHSIGILLSGMGSDGTQGVRAIKEMAGLVLVQDPASAQFDAMPRSAIEAGLADIVAPADTLYDHLMAYLGHMPTTPLVLHQDSNDYYSGSDQSALEKIITLLHHHTGHNFSHYKRSTLYRRIERRMRLHQLTHIDPYARYLADNSQERDLLFKELLIGVTRFFRDPVGWVALRDQAISAVLAQHPQGGTLRAWVAGCSTGEEAYSLAIVFKEALAQLQPVARYSLQVFATDLDADAINKARQGLYLETITTDVSAERLRRFFISEEGGGYRVSQGIREMITFAVQNLIQDPPFIKLDLLICRNLLIYLLPETQKKLMRLFHYSLHPGGFLFLGSAETVGHTQDMVGQFELQADSMRLYRSLAVRVPLTEVDFPLIQKVQTATRLTTAEAATAPTLQTLVDHLLLQRFTPAAVLATPEGDILYIHGRTGYYLEPAAGHVNWNLLVMAREGLRDELFNAFQQVLHQPSHEAVLRRGLQVKTNSHHQAVDLTVQLLWEPEALRGKVLVVLTHVPLPDTATKRKRKITAVESAVLNTEIQRLREALQATREEMQTSQEELKSTNEELQSTNEELQSTNEELTTSKEEMQSMNEELQTVNAELQAKVEELSRANNDMNNLLNSTDIATLFLDEGLGVRRFTTSAARLIKLIPGDVGRPITDIASDLIDDEFTTDVASVLRTLVFIEKTMVVQDGRWFTVRIMPYRTLDNRIDGVVVTFLEVTVAKNLELELRQARDDLAALLAHKNCMSIKWNWKCKTKNCSKPVRNWNKAWNGTPICMTSRPWPTLP